MSTIYRGKSLRHDPLRCSLLEQERTSARRRTRSAVTCGAPLAELGAVGLPRGQGGAVCRGSAGDRLRRSSGRRWLWCRRGAVVAGQAGEAGGEFVEPAVRAAEAGAQDAVCVAAAPEQIAAVVIRA